MKTKREIVTELVDNGAVTFDEALILLDFEVDKPTHQVFSPYTAITTTKTTPSTLTFTSNADLENK